MLDLLAATPREAAIDAMHAATAIYTKAHVVKGMFDLIDWPEQPGLLVDTSAGDGAFLVEALDRLAPDPDDATALDRIRAWEIHPGACRSARIAVAEKLSELGWHMDRARQAATDMIRADDFITDGPPAGSVTFLVGNPPFLKWGGIPEYLRGFYRDSVAKHARGDILHAFLDACDEALAPDGAIALITADRWLLNQTTAELREKLGRRNGIEHLARLDAESSFYRPKFRQTGTPPRIHPVAMLMRRKEAHHIALGRQPTYPGEDGAETEDGSSVPLSSIARVSLGPWVGPDGIFLITMEEARKAGIDARDLVRAVDTPDLPPGEDRLREPTKVAIATFRDRMPSEAILAHLRRTLPAMPARGRRSESTAWWTPPERLHEVSNRPSIVVPRIAQRLRAVELPPGVVVVNHNFHVISATDGLTNDDLIAILRSPEVQRTVATRAPRLENGFRDIRTGFLRDLPIPTALIEACGKERGHR